jgi:hypothetical protein
MPWGCIKARSLLRKDHKRLAEHTDILVEFLFYMRHLLMPVAEYITSKMVS